MTTTTGIRRADPGDTAAVTDLITTAFAPLAVSHWLVPDHTARTEILHGYFRILIEHALDVGVVYLADQATAVWVPWTSMAPPPEPEDYDTRLATATGPYANRFRALDTLFAEHHPSGTHHHLEFLAVHPTMQGQGLGGLLLTAHHRVLDRHGLPAYLEAADPRSRGLYARHGYGITNPGLLQLPDGGAGLWPMWRLPQQPAGTAPFRPGDR